jgi:hypothetical protein
MCNGFDRVYAKGIRLTVFAGVLFSAGCSLDVGVGGGGSSGDNDNDNGTPTSSNDAIIVVFRNLADDEAVDVEFYFAEGPLENVPEDLFLDENRVRDGRVIQEHDGIGLINSAILAPHEVDGFELSCDRELSLGTSGGMFLDAETGEELGTGARRWAQQGEQFDCGAIIEFTYDSDRDGFTTTLALPPQ